MTLSSVRRYDESRVESVGGRAVVVGASVAGLVAARVLSDAFEEVIVFDRDPLPDDAVARRGVPQSTHVHVLLEAGRSTLEDLFPGYCEGLLAAGGVLLDGTTDLRHFEGGDYLAPAPERLPLYCASRPLFESVARRRLRARENVELRGNRGVSGYVTDGDGDDVTGVIVSAGGADRELASDLVVDATGRTTRTPQWLADHGYRTPPVDEVDIDLAYSSVVVERPPGDRRGYLITPEPSQPRGCAIVPIEGDRWQVTLFGMHGETPPTDPADLAAFAAGLPPAEPAELLDAHARQSDDVAHYPFPATRRRRFEDLERFPDGLLVLGDGIASFNPIYGQGMSVAALEALQLHHALAGGIENLSSRFFDRAAAVVDVVWRMAVGSDFAFPATTGPKPRGTALVNRYVARLVRRAHTDGELTTAYYRVLRLERPPTTLFRPSIARRVLLPM